MGVSVNLAVLPDRVSKSTWDKIYEKARRVVNRWTPRPLSLAWRQVGAVRVAAYVLDIETPQGLHIVGDAETLTTGESFTFPARLARAASCDDEYESPAADADKDVLVAIARWMTSDFSQPCPGRNLLGSKTQGFPYHALIVALGLLVESSLPGTAVVHGVISPSEGEQARRGLESILDEAFKPPVVMDAERLRRRLAGSLHSNVVEQAIDMLGPSDLCSEAQAEELLSRLRRCSSAYELEQVVRTCATPGRLSTGIQQLFRRLGKVVRSNMARGELRARFEQWGATRTREELAHRTLKIGMRLTSKAWDAIEAADLDELTFLYAATCTDTVRWDVHHAVRAMFENPVLRCM